MRHLVERGGSFHARLSVPHALRPIIGKTELWAALHATDRRDANRKLPAAVAYLQALIDGARSEAKATRIQTAAPRPGQVLSPRQLALAHYSRELERDNVGRNVGKYDPAWREWSVPIYADKLRRVVSGAAPDAEADALIGWAIDLFAANGNVKVARGSIEWRALARQVAAIQLEIEKQKDARDRGKADSPPAHPLLTNQPEPTAAKDALAVRNIGPDSSKTLGEIALDYVKERHASPQTEYECKTTARLFEECMGEARPIYTIVRADVHTFKRMLADLPTNGTKRFPGMKVPEAIKANKLRATPYPALDPRTVNEKYLSKLHSMFAWCVRNDMLPDNPASGIKLEAVKAKQPPRVPFAPSDLGKIFAPSRFKKPGEQEWALLLALFTGARASELGQLKLDSIRTQREVLVLVIEEQTKNVGSQRVVPIHSTLLTLGFQKYVDRLRAKAETHVFPQWHAKASAAQERAKANGKETLNLHYPRFLPRWFKVTLLPSVGINDGRKSFHSFRHSFKSGLRDAGVERAMSDALCGHSDHSAGGVYLHGDSIEAKKAAIEKLRFDGFTVVSSS